MMTADGTYGHFKFAGSLDEQPAMDMEVFDCIKSKWCELRNKDMEDKWQQKR